MFISGASAVTVTLCSDGADLQRHIDLQPVGHAHFDIVPEGLLEALGLGFHLVDPRIQEGA